MKRKGFTLLEMVIVLDILSIMLGVAVLSITMVQERELDHMLEDLRFARTYAVAHQKSVRVHFDTDNNSYRVVSEDGSELLARQLRRITMDKPRHIGNTLVIYPTGAFSKCGHIPISYGAKSLYLNFTVGVARFTVTEP